MNVLFDHQVFSLHSYGGVTRYFSELIHGVNHSPGNQAHLPMLFCNNIHLNEIGFDVNSFFINRNFKQKRRIIYEINKLYTLPFLKRKQYDIIHPTYFDSYFIPYRKGKPMVITFHDMIHEKLAHRFRDLNLDKGIIERKRLLANQADKIIAVSESTKRDVVDILNIKPEKIEVIYHGSSFPPAEITSVKQPVEAEHPYFLFVGNRVLYKNFTGMLMAIHPVLKKNNVKLVCAGGSAFRPAETELIQSLGLADLVEQRSINDQILRNLYRQAIAFIFPSLYEGFGLPILEAFDCSCPCIVNDCSSLPEVAGDAALYVKFDESDSVVQALETILYDTDLRQKLIEKGQRRLANFSWQKTVDNTLNLYQSLV